MEGRPLEKNNRRDVWASEVRCFSAYLDEAFVLPKDYHSVSAWPLGDQGSRIIIVAERKKRVSNDAA